MVDLDCACVESEEGESDLGSFGFSMGGFYIRYPHIIPDTIWSEPDFGSHQFTISVLRAPTSSMKRLSRVVEGPIGKVAVTA